MPKNKDPRNDGVSPHKPKTAQQYIDQKPKWPGGEAIQASNISSMQWFIWWLACAGKFFEGALVFMSGLALPLVSMTFPVSVYERGFYTASVLIGIFIGALFLGGLSDRYGRKKMFVIEMIVLLFFLSLAIFSVNYLMLLLCLLGVGVALGCDYPTAHLMISESVPSGMRGRLILGAFGFQALGAFIGVFIAFLILTLHPYADAWRLFYAVLIIPILIIALCRLYVPESSIWLASNNQLKEARHSLQLLLKRQRHINVRPAKRYALQAKNLLPIFQKQYRRATILTSIPWFLQDLGTYGIGIFTPIILMGILGYGTHHIVHNVAGTIHVDQVSARYTMALDSVLMLGIVMAVLLVDRIGRIWLQVIGFIGCGVGLWVVALTYRPGQQALVGVLIGFIIFNFMTNMGPNTQTYLLSGECFPTSIRARGAGFAASVGKVGAILVAFLFPVLYGIIGVVHIVELLIAASWLGALVTWLFRINTDDVNLEKM